jgi:hypothetical protein
MDEPIRKRTENDPAPEPSVSELVNHLGGFSTLLGNLKDAWQGMKDEANEQDKQS